MKAHRKMLSNWQSPAIQSLLPLIESQSKETLLTWVLDYVDRHLLPLYQAYVSNDDRPNNAILAARAWVKKEIKLPQAKVAILACHEAAKEATHPVAMAAARAIGQSASTIHSARHCIGLVLYGALAISYHHLGLDAAWKTIEGHADTIIEDMKKALLAISKPDESHPSRIDWFC